MSSENPIECEFLKQYLEGHLYSDDMIRQYYTTHPSEIFSLYKHFHDLLKIQSQKITNEEFHDIYHRFTFLHIDEEGFLHQIDKNEKASSLSPYLYGAKTNMIGYIHENTHLYDLNNHPVAHRVGQFDSFYHFSIGWQLSGRWNELICQLPESYRHSTQQYYLIPELLGFRYNTHHVKMSVYDVIDTSC